MFGEHAVRGAQTATDPLRDRARGALYGLAIGDALGMPTQLLSRGQIAALYGGPLEDFQPGPAENEISRGMAAGTVTDDTEQALIIGRELVRTGGHVDRHALADALMDWERAMVARGSCDLLGPSTKRALARFAEGDIETAGRWGDTNGAAMRVTPVGVATPVTPLPTLCARVAQASELTHNTSIAIAAASAVAAAVSAGLEGATTHEALDVGIEGARGGARFGGYVGGADVSRRIAWAVELVSGRNLSDALDDVYELVGTGVASQEAVPAAFAIAALAPDDPWLGCRLAAGLGGDTDTVAAMAGAILGACNGLRSLPLDAVVRVREANPELGLDALAGDLLALRHRCPTPALR